AVICDAPPTVAATSKVTVVGVPLSVAVAEVVSGPGVNPKVRVVVACPLISVCEDVGFTLPPPEAAPHNTVTPCTGLPPASVINTSCGVPSVLFTGPESLSPELLLRWAAAPTVAVAVNVTGLPAKPAAVAVSVFAPATAPSRHEVTCAIPVVPVASGSTGATLPPPDTTANCTAIPDTAFPCASRTITAGGVATGVPAVALCPSPPLLAIDVAGPALTTLL